MKLRGLFKLKDISTLVNVLVKRSMKVFLKSMTTACLRRTLEEVHHMKDIYFCGDHLMAQGKKVMGTINEKNLEFDKRVVAFEEKHGYINFSTEVLERLRGLALLRIIKNDPRDRALV